MGRILRIYPGLDRGSLEYGRRQLESLTRRDADHPFHQVHAGHLFGDAMLDLQTRVDFEKVKLPGGWSSLRRRTTDGRGGIVTLGERAVASSAATKRRSRRPRLRGSPRKMDDLCVWTSGGKGL